MEYVKRSSIGVIKKCEEGDASHVIQTPAEYKELLEIAKMYRDELHHAELQNKDLKEKYSSLQKKIEKMLGEKKDFATQIQELESQIKDNRKMYSERINELGQKIAEREEAVRQAQKLNENLRRICRERANSDRGITPKKEHDGYLVLQSREWRERLPDRRMVRTWKSVLQTPYDVSIEQSVIEEQILEDLTEKVLVDIGCLHYVSPEDNGIYTYVDDENVLYCWRYSADYKSGYWCVILYTTRPLIVPVERRYKNSQRTKHRK